MEAERGNIVNLNIIIIIINYDTLLYVHAMRVNYFNVDLYLPAHMYSEGLGSNFHLPYMLRSLGHVEGSQCYTEKTLGIQ